jgi:hypothetical protein
MLEDTPQYVNLLQANLLKKVKKQLPEQKQRLVENVR